MSETKPKKPRKIVVVTVVLRDKERTRAVFAGHGLSANISGGVLHIVRNVQGSYNPMTVAMFPVGQWFRLDVEPDFPQLGDLSSARWIE